MNIYYTINTCILKHKIRQSFLSHIHSFINFKIILYITVCETCEQIYDKAFSSYVNAGVLIVVDLCMFVWRLNKIMATLLVTLHGETFLSENICQHTVEERTLLHKAVV